MYRPRKAWLPLAGIATLAACQDTPTAVSRHESWAEDLEFVLPEMSADLLAFPDTSGAHAATRSGYAELDTPVAEYIDPSSIAMIYDAHTVAGFSPGYGYATGSHWYQGNKSRIETTATIALDGEHLGSQRAFREADRSFILDAGTRKHIFAHARVYTDRTCGLTAWGGSDHTAWWEAVWPPPHVARFGLVGVSSQSSLAHQGTCAPPPPPEPGFGGGGGGGGWGYTTCYFWITYDERTGTVYSAELLYCEDIGG
jgi:hypothetical protein